MFSFKEEKVDKLHPVGRGTGGTVYPYDKRPNNQKEWVVKELVTKVEDLKHIVQEIVFGFNHDHPFIMSIAGYHIQDFEKGSLKIYIRMPKMKKSLGDFISNNQFNKGKVSQAEAKKTIIKWFYCLADALNYLKKKNIAHRDIKPENILLDDKNNVYLSDLGLSKFSGEDVTSYLTNIAGTPKYMAPELGDTEFLKKLRPDDLFRADVWSLGMTILDLCSDISKNVPYPGNFKEIGKNIDLILKDIEKKLEMVAERYGSELKELLSNILVLNPHKRWTFEQICEFLQSEFSDNLDEIFKVWEQRIEDLHGGHYFKTRQNLLDRLNQLTEGYYWLDWQKLRDNLDDKFNFEFREDFLIEPKDPSERTENELKTSIGHIFESIEGNLSQILRSIKINFNYCVSLNAETAELIKFDKPQFERVQKLSLDFSSCENMLTKDGKLPFAPNCLKGLTGLKSFDLNLSGFENLQNQNLEEVYNLIITNLPKLEKLSLNFCSCQGISISDEDGFERLKSYLNRLPFLKEFSIRMARSGDLSFEILETWTKALKKINKLRVVELDI